MSFSTTSRPRSRPAASRRAVAVPCRKRSASPRSTISPGGRFGLRHGVGKQPLQPDVADDFLNRPATRLRRRHAQERFRRRVHGDDVRLRVQRQHALLHTDENRFLLVALLGHDADLLFELRRHVVEGGGEVAHFGRVGPVESVGEIAVHKVFRAGAHDLEGAADTRRGDQPCRGGQHGECDNADGEGLSGPGGGIKQYPCGQRHRRQVAEEQSPEDGQAAHGCHSCKR